MQQLFEKIARYAVQICQHMRAPHVAVAVVAVTPWIALVAMAYLLQ